MAYLVTFDSSVIKKRYRLDADLVVIGRHPSCDIVIEDNAVSRRHAQIRRAGNQYFVSDLNSRNGTVVNKETIQKESLLYDNSEIEICDVVFNFLMDEDFSQVKPRPTVADKSKSSRASFAIDDIPNQQSSILRQLDLPSRSGTRSSYHEGSFGQSGVQKISTLEKKLSALMTVTQSLNDAHDPDSIMGKVLDSLFDLFIDADRGFVAMRDEDGKIVPFAMKTRHPQDAERVRISRTVINTVLDSQQAILSSDAAADQRFDLSQSMTDFRIRSLMCAPLINSQGIANGAIQLDTLRSAIAFDEGDLEVLVTAAMQASLALQNVELYQKVAAAKRIEEDLKLAHEVQQRFLPQRHPQFHGFDFFTYYSPMAQVGGDYYDFVQLDENRMAIIVADVVGHGIAAAMLMAKISAESRFAIALNNNPVAAMAHVNRSLSNMNLDKFVTLIAGLIDFKQNTVTFVNAGHLPPLHIQSSSGETTELDFTGAGLPLGILDTAEYGSYVMQIEPGDSIVMYTDGVSECMNIDGEQLGTPNLIAEIKLSQAKQADSIGKIICQTVKRHRGTAEQIDDICVVVVGRT
ncbi:MAG: SpoIIE family protein phosphatase [Pirellulaceae bacterium]